MTAGITCCTLSGKQEAVGEQPSICGNLANSVYSAAETNSSKKPGKCIGRAVGEAENPRKTAIMSICERGKVPPKVFYCGPWKVAQLQVHILFVRNRGSRGDQRKGRF